MPHITKFREKIEHTRPKVKIFDYNTGKMIEILSNEPIMCRTTSSDSYPVHNYKIDLSKIIGV